MSTIGIDLGLDALNAADAMCYQAEKTTVTTHGWRL